MANGIAIKDNLDTGWQMINSSLSYRQINDVVYLSVASQSSSSGSTIGTLPAKLRPRQADVMVSLIADNYISPIRFWEIQIYRNTGDVVSWGNTGAGLSSIISYPLT